MPPVRSDRVWVQVGEIGAYTSAARQFDVMRDLMQRLNQRIGSIHRPECALAQGNHDKTCNCDLTLVDGRPDEHD